MASAERKLPDQHFRRQVPIRHFIADFASHRAKLVIEVDRGQHRFEADAERTAVIEDEGYRVIRFWNNDVLANADGVWTVIDEALRMHAKSHSLPLMGRGRGGVTPDVERGSTVTPTHPSPIEGEG